MTGTVPKFRKELHSGTVALVLLALLERSDGDMYGYRIAKLLEEAGGLPVKQGTLYPVLRSLEAQGLLESGIVPSESGPPRKEYAITQAGREALAQWTAVWVETRDFVDGWLEDDRG
ncbi:MAG: PadR family transcriptional regulator [Actinobacteria bacterium]|nr:PadR family transcriptional regulator [Actinomycetota bacterium]